MSSVSFIQERRKSDLAEMARYATLGFPAAETEGKSQPPWAERYFCHRFTGVPPLDVYIAMGMLK